MAKYLKIFTDAETKYQKLDVRKAQRAAMDAYGWNTADFIREFGRNYL